MSKKQYMKPEMTVVITNPRQSLLVGSVRGSVKRDDNIFDTIDWGGESGVDDYAD